MSDPAFDARMQLARRRTDVRRDRSSGTLAVVRDLLGLERPIDAYRDGFDDAVDTAVMLLHGGLQNDLGAAVEAFRAHKHTAAAEAETANGTREEQRYRGRADGWQAAVEAVA